MPRILRPPNVTPDSSAFTAVEDSSNATPQLLVRILGERGSFIQDRLLVTIDDLDKTLRGDLGIDPYPAFRHLFEARQHARHIDGVVHQLAGFAQDLADTELAAQVAFEIAVEAAAQCR